MKQSFISKLLWGLVIVLALILLTLLACLFFAENETPTAPVATATPVAPVATATSKLEIDPNAGALITPTPAPQAPGVAIPGWGSLKFPSGVTEVYTTFKNPEANDGWYYLTFELSFKDTNEVIFTTGLIPPGQYCNKVTLTRPLEPGEYTAVMHVQPYRMDANLTPTNNANMETLLIVE